jgi:hypothetical protein
MSGSDYIYNKKSSWFKRFFCDHISKRINRESLGRMVWVINDHSGEEFEMYADTMECLKCGHVHVKKTEVYSG